MEFQSLKKFINKFSKIGHDEQKILDDYQNIEDGTLYKTTYNLTHKVDKNKQKQTKTQNSKNQPKKLQIDICLDKIKKMQKLFQETNDKFIQNGDSRTPDSKIKKIIKQKRLKTENCEDYQQSKVGPNYAKSTTSFDKKSLNSLPSKVQSKQISRDSTARNSQNFRNKKYKNSLNDMVSQSMVEHQNSNEFGIDQTKIYEYNKSMLAALDESPLEGESFQKSNILGDFEETVVNDSGGDNVSAVGNILDDEIMEKLEQIDKEKEKQIKKEEQKKEEQKKEEQKKEEQKMVHQKCRDSLIRLQNEHQMPSDEELLKLIPYKLLKNVNFQIDKFVEDNYEYIFHLLGQCACRKCNCGACRCPPAPKLRNQDQFKSTYSSTICNDYKKYYQSPMMLTSRIAFNRHRNSNSIKSTSNCHFFKSQYQKDFIEKPVLVERAKAPVQKYNGILTTLSSYQSQFFDWKNYDQKDLNMKQSDNLPVQGLDSSVFKTSADRYGDHSDIDVIQEKQSPKSLVDVLPLNSSHLFQESFQRNQEDKVIEQIDKFKKIHDLEKKHKREIQELQKYEQEKMVNSYQGMFRSNAQRHYDLKDPDICPSPKTKKKVRDQLISKLNGLKVITQGEK